MMILIRSRLEAHSACRSSCFKLWNSRAFAPWSIRFGCHLIDFALTMSKTTWPLSTAPVLQVFYFYPSITKTDIFKRDHL